MNNQSILNVAIKHGTSLLKIGLVVMVGSISNQVLKVLTQDSILEMVRDVKYAKTQYQERKQSA